MVAPLRRSVLSYCKRGWFAVYGLIACVPHTASCSCGTCREHRCPWSHFISSPFALRRRALSLCDHASVMCAVRYLSRVCLLTARQVPSAPRWLTWHSRCARRGSEALEGPVRPPVRKVSPPLAGRQLPPSPTPEYEKHTADVFVSDSRQWHGAASGLTSMPPGLQAGKEYPVFWPTRRSSAAQKTHHSPRRPARRARAAACWRPFIIVVIMNNS